MMASLANILYNAGHGQLLLEVAKVLFHPAFRDVIESAELQLIDRLVSNLMDKSQQTENQKKLNRLILLITQR